MHLEFIPFIPAHLDEAARLLAIRHQRDRSNEPALPERFNNVQQSLLAIKAVLEKPRASGVVAQHGGQMLGYLIGVPQMDVRGRAVWIPLAGHAVDAEEGAELYRDLYAALAPQWLATGCFAHYILVPAEDRAALDAWFALSFGQEQAHAIRETAVGEMSITTNELAGIEIRRARPEDLDAILEVADIIMRYQAGPPVYAPFFPEAMDNAREGYAKDLVDPDVTLWLAWRDGHVAGFQLYSLANQSDDNLIVPEHCIELNIGATRQEERGRGVARALTNHGLAWAHTQGYKHCLVDWRVTNLLSSRFWPRQGFRPLAYRLTRRIDERVLWAHG